MLPPDDALVKNHAIRQKLDKPLDNFGTVQSFSNARNLVKHIQSPPFDETGWTFGRESDAERTLRPFIERIASKPQLAIPRFRSAFTFKTRKHS